MDFLLYRHRPGDAMHSFCKKGSRIVIRFSLYVLRETNADRSAVRGIGQDAHGIDHRTHQLLRPLDSVPVFHHRLKGIIGGGRKRRALLQLLQHRIRLSGRIGVRWKKKEGDLVHGRRRRRNHHIGSAGSDRRGAGDDFSPVALFGIGDGTVAHSLLIPALHHLDTARIRVQRLSQSERDSMPEDGKKSFYKLGLFPVHADILLIQKLHNRLCDRQSDGLLLHGLILLFVTSFRLRGSLLDYNPVFSLIYFLARIAYSKGLAFAGSCSASTTIYPV